MSPKQQPLFRHEENIVLADDSVDGDDSNRADSHLFYDNSTIFGSDYGDDDDDLDNEGNDASGRPSAQRDRRLSRRGRPSMHSTTGSPAERMVPHDISRYSDTTTTPSASKHAQSSKPATSVNRNNMDIAHELHDGITHCIPPTATTTRTRPRDSGMAVMMEGIPLTPDHDDRFQSSRASAPIDGYSQNIDDDGDEDDRKGLSQPSNMHEWFSSINEASDRPVNASAPASMPSPRPKPFAPPLSWNRNQYTSTNTLIVNRPQERIPQLQSQQNNGKSMVAIPPTTPSLSYTPNRLASPESSMALSADNSTPHGNTTNNLTNACHGHDHDDDHSDGYDSDAPSFMPRQYEMQHHQQPKRHNTPIASPSGSSNLSSSQAPSVLSGRSGTRSHMSYRSSTSLSLLYGEVINIGTAAAAAKRYGGRRSSAAQPNEGEKYSSQRFDDIESPPLALEGMEIGGGRRQSHHTSRSHPHHDDGGNSTVAFSSVFPSNEFVQHIKNKTVFLSKTTQQRVGRAFGFFGSTQSKVLNNDRPPPKSPSNQHIDDLKTLKARHQEKLGPWQNDPEANFERQQYFDFCLVLTPQESYRYWSELLDFRVEHLGEDASDNLTPKAASLETCSTRSTDDSEAPYEKYIQSQHLQLNDRKPSQGSPLQEAEFATPKTGIHRRRGGGTLSGTANRSKAPSSPFVMDLETPPPPSASSNRLSTSTMMTRAGKRLSMFEKAIVSPVNDQDDIWTPSQTFRKSTGPRPSMSSARRRWGNRTVGEAANKLSPPVRSLTRGNSVRKKLQVNLTPSTKLGDVECGSSVALAKPNDENRNPNEIRIEEIPNQVIPRGIAARTNGMLQFLSALKRGIIVRRHRPNKTAVYCKLFSTDDGDTIQYQLIDAEEAMVGFKEQRIRFNRNIGNSSTPATVRAMTKDWACLDEPDADEECVHKFAVPDHIAAQRYREKVKQKGTISKMADIAARAANSGIFRTSDIVAVHPAQHPDPRSRRNELGTSTLRKSQSLHYTPHTFSLITLVGSRFTSNGQKDAIDVHENKWYSGDGNDIQFKAIDFEAATEGEYWLIFRGFLLLHRDAAVGRFATQRRAGIGGGKIRTRDLDGENGDDAAADEIENRLHRNEFEEPATVGCLEKTFVKWRKLDTTYMTGSVKKDSTPPPSDYFLGFSSSGTQIWSRLRLAGLETQRIYAVDNNRVMIKVSCPEDRLIDVAEVLRVKLKTLDGSFAPFREDTIDIFKPRYDAMDCPSEYLGKPASLLRSKDRQMIIDFIIGSRIRDSGAELGETTDLGKMIEGRVPLHIHSKLEPLYQTWVFFWSRSHWTGRDGRSLLVEPDPSDGLDETVTLLDKKFDDAKDANVVPLRERKPPNFFRRLFVGAFYQPLDSVEDYFGEQVSFYFAWLQHIASHLLILTIFGFIVMAFQLSNNDFDHPIRPVFSMIIMLWTFVVLVNWRKRSNFLAHRWGTMDHKVQETTRPEFHGQYVQDEVTKEWVVIYPKWKRWIKYAISVPVSLLFAAFAMLLILMVHANRDLQLANYITQLKSSNSTEPYDVTFSLEAIIEPVKTEKIELTRDMLFDGTIWLLMGALPAMLGLCIPILNLILMRVSVMLNNFENYRTESEYRAALIVKVFSFRFVSQFGTVYYYACLSSMGTKEDIQNGIVRMGSSLLIYTTVSHWFQILLQVYLFMLIRQIRRIRYNRMLRGELRNIELAEEAMEDLETKEAKERRHVMLVNKRILLDQAQDDVWFEVMNPPHNSFPEYITAIVQFTFVACFSVVMPVIPFFCLINCLLSMRFDAYKICRGRRRPLAQKTGGMGVWEHLLHIVAVIAVLTNCWLMGFTNSNFTWLAKQIGNTGLFAVVVAWEHIMLLIKYVMQTNISPLPKSVRDRLRKDQHRAERERNYTLMARKRSRRPKMHKSGSQLWLPGGNESFDDSFRLAKQETRMQRQQDEAQEQHHHDHQPLHAESRVLQTIHSSEEEGSGLYHA